MNRTFFYDMLRDKKRGLFPKGISQSQVDGIEGLLSAFDDVGDGRRDTLAYGLATAYHETGARMVPVREGLATTDAGARAAVNKLAKARGPKSAVARYALPAGPYGHVYYGRGHVQLTWLENYEKSSADAGKDLVQYPDAMLDPVISARVLFRGLLDGRWNGKGKGLRFYLDKGDWVEARRTVNVLDKAQEIARYAQIFHEALVAAHYFEQPARKLPHNPVVKQSLTTEPISNPYKLPNGTIWAKLAKLIGV